MSTLQIIVDKDDNVVGTKHAGELGYENVYRVLAQLLTVRRPTPSMAKSMRVLGVN
jgi:hypothetical protein